MLENPTFWVAAAFVLFVALSYKKISALLVRALDDRSAKIAAELNQARALREEAEQVLAEYRRRQAESMKEAEAILAKARADADLYRRQAEADLKSSMDARMRQALEKIAQEEGKAIKDVRDHVVDISLAAARSLVADQLSAMSHAALLKLALADVEKTIH